MTPVARLVLSVLSWAISIPALNVLLTGLERHRGLPLSGPAVALVAGGLILWGGLIYFRQVPSTRSVARRIAYLITYLAAMILLGLAALWMAFWVTAAIHGL